MSAQALGVLAGLANADLVQAGSMGVDGGVRRESRALLFGFAEYHLERRMRSLPMLVRSGP